MASFPDVLKRVRDDYKDYFDEASRRPPEEDDRRVEVVDVEIPRPKEFDRRQQMDEPLELPGQGRPWWEIEPDEDDFERDTPRSRAERDGFDRGDTRVGIERLAVYLPFHFYPQDHWGVRCFERPMGHFAGNMYREFLRHGLHESPARVLKMAFYSVARHEFHHYLTELEAARSRAQTGTQYLSSVLGPRV
jgi:hypothetical protein